MRRTPFLARFALILSLVLVYFSLSQVSVLSRPSMVIADSFDFPFDSPTRIIGYDIHPSFSRNTCFGVDIRETWHAGEDWFGPAGTLVRTVANGTVRYVHPIERDYPGSVVIIEHVLSDGGRVYSMYGHLREPPPVNVNQIVAKGDPIGYILDQGSNSHLHWEIRNFFDGSFICNNNLIPGPGYTYPGHPDSYGYKNPTGYVNARRKLGDIGGLVKISGSGAVVSGAEVKFVGGGVTRTTTTDGSGRYLFSGVPAGNARITASKPGVGSGFRDVTVLSNASTVTPDIFLVPICPAGVGAAVAGQEVLSAATAAGVDPCVGVDNAKFVDDVTYRDDSVLSPNQSFTKLPQYLFHSRSEIVSLHRDYNNSKNQRR